MMANTTLAPSPLAILFAEDSRVARRLVRHMLTKRGHEVDTVDDGEQALLALNGRSYDVALIDFHLQKLDGLQVVAQFKAARKEDRERPRFIGCTADIEGLLTHPDIYKILDLVVGKPLDIMHLCGVLEALQQSPRESGGHLGDEVAPGPEMSYDGEERRAASRTKVVGGDTHLVIQSGERFACRVTNLSLGGAALDIETRPAIGEVVIVGRAVGRVSRHTPTGIALDFADA